MSFQAANAARDRDALRRYLLGELGEAERDAVEERYLFDEAYAAVRDEVEVELVDAYVDEKLSAEERRHFEENYAVTGERRDAIQSAWMLRVYRESAARKDVVRRFPARGWYWLAAAAAVGAAFAGIVGWNAAHRSAPATTEAKTRARAPFVSEPPQASVTQREEGSKDPVRTAASPKKTETASAPLPAPAVAARGSAAVPPPFPEPPVIAPPAPVAVIGLKPDLPAGDCPSLPPGAATVSAVAPRKIAVQPFDYSAVRNQVTAVFGNDLNIGQGIRAMLAVKMGQSKDVRLLERESLKTMLAEQDLSATNRVGQGTKAKIGGPLGTDAVLLGDVVIFGRDDTQARSGLGAAGGIVGGRLGGAIASPSRKNDKAVVAINLRIVDARTGEVLATSEARGESSRTSTDFSGLASGWKGGTGAASSMTSSNFAETIIGEATQNAVSQIAAFLEKQAPAIPAGTRAIESRVAAIQGCTLTLALDGSGGVHVGDRFEIYKIVNNIVDPDTKDVLDQQTEKMGEAVVTTVRDKVAVVQYNGQPISMTYPRGYLARLVPR